METEIKAHLYFCEDFVSLNLKYETALYHFSPEKENNFYYFFSLFLSTQL
jgi:hypothetical protein